jgi:hypothetical protein
MSEKWECSFKVDILKEKIDKQCQFVGRLTTFSTIEDSDTLKVLVSPLYMIENNDFIYLGHTWMIANEELSQHQGENYLFQAVPYRYKKLNRKYYSTGIMPKGKSCFLGKSPTYKGVSMYHIQANAAINRKDRRQKNKNLEIIKAFERGTL